MREVAVRYRQTALGVVWVIIQPLLAALVFAAVFGRLAGLPSDGVAYLPFAFSGTLAWGLLAQGLQRSSFSLVGEANLITKVYFPRLLLPTASVLSALTDFLVGLAVMGVFLAVYRVPMTPRLLLLPAFIAGILLLTLGLSLLLSALGAYYRDFMHAVPFMLQVWLYASPVVYSPRLIPPRWMTVYSLNPMVGLLEGFRWSLFPLNLAFPWNAAGLGLLGAVLALLVGSVVFRSIERRLADVV